MSTRGPYRKGEQVREDILRAAGELLAERMPRQISVRDVAERAGVQHSVVHRHFDTKDRLLAEVVKHTTAEYATSIADISDPAEAFATVLAYMADHRATFATLARTLMTTEVQDGVDVFPGFESHLRSIEAAAAAQRPARSPSSDGTTVSPRVLTLGLMALVSGWAFLEDWWLMAGGFTDADREDVRSQINVLIEQLVQRNAPGS